jgi:hypothetical protein
MSQVTEVWASNRAQNNMPLLFLILIPVMYVDMVSHGLETLGKDKTEAF